MVIPIIHIPKELVKKVHRTVRDALICRYLENSNKFNLINSLNEVVIIYNNSVHRTTKFKLINIFKSEDEETLKLIFENTINSN